MRWTWTELPDESVRALAHRLEEGWTPGEEGQLKRGSDRAVWRVPLGDGSVLLKRFVVPGARRLLHVVRNSRAAAECQAACALRDAGIPTATAIGFGERRAGGLLKEAFYLGRFLPDATTLGDWMRDRSRAGRQAEVHDAAGNAMELVAALHRVPWHHRDLHANNILRMPDGSLVLIDLHSAWRVAHITRAIRLNDLARLLYSLREFIDLRRAPELLAAYRRAAGAAAPSAADAMDALDRFELDYVRGRTARCVKQSTLFTVERHPDGRAFRRRTYPASALDEDIRQHRAILGRGGPDVLGSAPRSRVTRVGQAGCARVVKEYVMPGRAGSFRQRLGRGRPRSAWIGARRLDVLDIPTPEALALLERPDGSAILVTRESHEAITLRQLLDRPPTSPPLADRVDIATQVGWLVGRLGRAGVRHDDLSTKNVLLQRAAPSEARDVRDRSPTGAWSVLLIDLDNLEPMPRHDRAGLLRMLTQLFDVPACVTRTDRRRFEVAYERAAGRLLPRDLADEALAGAAARAQRRRQRSRRRSTEAASLGVPPASATGATE